MFLYSLQAVQGRQDVFLRPLEAAHFFLISFFFWNKKQSISEHTTVKGESVCRKYVWCSLKSLHINCNETGLLGLGHIMTINP